MRRRRKEYMRRTPYKKKTRNGSWTRSYGRSEMVRRLLIGLSAAVLAALLIVLAVNGIRRLHDNAVEDKLAKTSAEHQGTGAGYENDSTNDGSGPKDAQSGGSYGGDGLNEGDNPQGDPSDGSGIKLVGTDNTPEPEALPSASPLPLPTPSPEPTSNGHELDNEMVIVIDAGHGGYDGGSVVDDVIEKDINLAVAQEIARLLEEHGGITVVQTRSSDEYLSKQERCDIANEAKCDYFVSVHCNTYGDDTSVRGFECHYNEKSSEGAVFAQSVTDDMKQYKDMKIRSVKPNNLAVTVHTYAPAILIEMGFLTNAAERANLTNPDYQKQLAERITKAVLKAAGL